MPSCFLVIRNCLDHFIDALDVSAQVLLILKVLKLITRHLLSSLGDSR